MDFDERQQIERATLPHLDAAYNLARWLTQDEHGAEDVVQEAYLRAGKYFASFRGDDGRVWVLGIVRHASFDWLAKRKKEPIAFDEGTHDHGDESTSPVFVAIRKSDQEQVRKALENLNPHLREAIVLRELEGLSYQEIATVTAQPIGTVMSRISRGRHQLQLRLASCQEEEEL